MTDDGKLYFFVGENENGANSQSLTTRFGKVLRINKDGTIPSDNPTSQFPAFYVGKYFYADLCGGRIHYIDSAHKAHPFAKGINRPVDLKVAGGMLYYLFRDEGDGGVGRIRYTSQP